MKHRLVQIMYYVVFLYSADFYCERSTRYCTIIYFTVFITPQWGAADAEIKVQYGENTELKLSHFKAWSRSVYSHTCYAYCQEFLPCLCLPFQSIHLYFFSKPLPIFPLLAVANTWFLRRPAECNR